jgi:hypothetical protein
VTAATLVEQRAGTLLGRVLAAAIRNMTAPNGEPFDVSIDERHGETAVTYRQGPTVLAVRRFRVAERTGIVSLSEFELPSWWFDGTAIHEQFVANLTEDDRDGGAADCLLTATLTGSRSRTWTRYFDWAHDMANANAAALASGVEAITPPPSAADGTDDAVWGGSDLAERVQLIAGPDPRTGDGRGSWRHLVRSTTPSQLADALDDLHDGLAQTVFAHVGAWYGEHAVVRSGHDLAAPSNAMRP